MRTLSADSRASLMKSAKSYRRQLQSAPDAMAYLTERGFTAATIDRFALGFVGAPEVGDEKFAGRISIPYTTGCHVKGRSVMHIKYRAIDGREPKYDSYAGRSRPLFGVEDLLSTEDYICITEGAFDAIAAKQAGLRAVGLDSATSWEPWMPRLFRGFRRVIVLQDKGDAGFKLAKKIASAVDNVQIIQMPDDDVNHALVHKGEEWLKGLVE